ncbi:hypothetical protein BGW38_009976 [Lunasporangiospora selenospora]|uniref:tRNA(Ile)-lysidine synthetase n=1 Tax=Lunasporangiospora selenospora TaxID=979761 RepID=A0A9P6FX33_9FUNG|nr:hypothetical protein BGW38_009976 [Lunasporangiospora selenospora]
MGLPRTLARAITSSEFAQCLAPFQRTLIEIDPIAASPKISPDRHRTPDHGGLVPQTAIDQHEPSLVKNIGIAVSGGVDSMALVTMLCQHFAKTPRQFPGAIGSNNFGSIRLHALIVDHKLRDNSTEEARFVARQVQKLNVVPHVLTLDWSGPQSDGCDLQNKPGKAHLETRARLERYKAIAQRCHALNIQQLFVGHHAGDQIETVLFRLSRASGIDGLAGIQAVAPFGVMNVSEALGLQVMRPLLQVSKDRLRATCEEAGTKWVEDPSNKSLDYQRNVIRHFQQMTEADMDKGSSTKMKALSSNSLLEFRDRMDKHRRVAWDQVKPWLEDVQFDTRNGICFLKIPTATREMTQNFAQNSPVANTSWIHNSQTPVATRLLSFIVRWVGSRDHSPRSEDIHSLLVSLRRPSLLASTPEKLITTDDMNKKSSSSTVYKREKKRVSKWAAAQLHEERQRDSGPVAADQAWPSKSKEGFIHSTLAVAPINTAGVMFSPPRSTKGRSERWVVSRQPMSRWEQHKCSFNIQLKDNQDMEIIWDQRFFVTFQQDPHCSKGDKDQKLRIRPLNMSDIQALQNPLGKHPSISNIQHWESQDLEPLKQFMNDVPAKMRLAIPAIVSQSMSDDGDVSETLVSVPTLGLHFYEPGKYRINCRFKSSSLTELNSE